MQSELDIVWKNNNSKSSEKVVPVFQQGHKKKYFKALKTAKDNGDISRGDYYKLRREYEY